MINDYYPNHAVSKAKKNISNLRRCVTLGITRIPHGFKQSLADTLCHELEKQTFAKKTHKLRSTRVISCFINHIVTNYKL